MVTLYKTKKGKKAAKKRLTNLSVNVAAYRELWLGRHGDVDERWLRAEVFPHFDQHLKSVAPVQLLLLPVVVNGRVIRFDVDDSRYGYTRLANDRRSGRLRDSEIIIDFKILVSEVLHRPEFGL